MKKGIILIASIIFIACKTEPKKEKTFLDKGIKELNDAGLINEISKDEINEIKEGIQDFQNMTFKEWKKHALADKEDIEMQNMTDEELRQTFEMAKKMSKAMLK